MGPSSAASEASVVFFFLWRVRADVGTQTLREGVCCSTGPGSHAREEERGRESFGPLSVDQRIHVAQDPYVSPLAPPLRAPCKLNLVLLPCSDGMLTDASGEQERICVQIRLVQQHTAVAVARGRRHNTPTHPHTPHTPTTPPQSRRRQRGQALVCCQGSVRYRQWRRRKDSCQYRSLGLPGVGVAVASDRQKCKSRYCLSRRIASGL